MVSKGWRRDLAQSDARALARLFLSPSMASDEDDVDDEDDLPPPPPPPRLMTVDSSADERRRRCLLSFCLRSVTPPPTFGTSPADACGVDAGTMRLLGAAAEALPTRHNARQTRILPLNGFIIVANQVGVRGAMQWSHKGQPSANGTKMSGC